MCAGKVSYSLTYTLENGESVKLRMKQQQRVVRNKSIGVGDYLIAPLYVHLAGNSVNYRGLN